MAGTPSPGQPIISSGQAVTAPIFPAKREIPWHVSFIPRVLREKSASLKLPSATTSNSSVERLRASLMQPGQFVSAVAEDENGKQQTRAYSIASAPAAITLSCASIGWRRVSSPITWPICPICPSAPRFRSTARTATLSCRSPSPTPSSLPPAPALRPCAPMRSGCFPSRRPRPQQRQGDLAGLRHPPRDRHLLPATSSRRSPRACPTSTTCPR